MGPVTPPRHLSEQPSVLNKFQKESTPRRGHHICDVLFLSTVYENDVCFVFYALVCLLSILLKTIAYLSHNSNRYFDRLQEVLARCMVKKAQKKKTTKTNF